MSMTEKMLIGRKGEDYCCEYLRKKGYHIIEERVFCGRKEIDIVAEDEQYIVFAEVKTRTDDPDIINRYGPAARAVDTEKIRNIKAASKHVMHELKKRGICKPPRIDVLEVYLLDTGDPDDFIPIRVHHMINVHEPRGRYGKNK